MLFYAISNRNLNKKKSLYLQLKKYILLGANWLQIREKDLEDNRIFLNVLKISPLAKEKNVKLLINGRVDIAYLCGAYGVHLPSESIPIREVKRKFKKLFVIKSCHTISEIKKAEKEGADAVTLSPIFKVPSKNGILRPLGIECLKEAVALSRIPVFALGGISEKNIISVCKTGVYGVAAVRFFNEINKKKLQEIKQFAKKGE